MLKKTISYTDFMGVERTEDFYFNLSKAECVEKELTTPGGYKNTIESIVKALNEPELMRIFKELILESYGERSADGRRFMKSPEMSKAFTETPAYDILFNELVTDSKTAAAFVNGIMPPVEKEQTNGNIQQFHN